MAHNISRRHHYLPEFYLKGFVNGDNQLCVFDKESGIINHRSPSQVFYEWNRNLFEVNGVDDDYVERLYSMMDNDLAVAYNKVRSQSPEETVFKDIIPMIFFVGYTFWRIPMTDQVIKSFLSDSSPEDLHFAVYEYGQRLPNDHEIYERIMSRADFVQGYRMMKPIYDYMKYLAQQKTNDWKLYNAASDVQLHLVGDSPTILKSSLSENIFDTELIFPLTKGKTLYHTRGERLKELRPEHRISVDILLFLQSIKYVAGPNKTYLECIAQLADQYDTDEKVASLRSEVFDIFEIDV